MRGSWSAASSSALRQQPARPAPRRDRRQRQHGRARARRQADGRASASSQERRGEARDAAVLEACATSDAAAGRLPQQQQLSADSRRDRRDRAQVPRQARRVNGGDAAAGQQRQCRQQRQDVGNELGLREAEERKHEHGPDQQQCGGRLAGARSRAKPGAVRRAAAWSTAESPAPAPA